MSTLLPTSAPPTLLSCMETCVPLYGSTYMSESPYVNSHSVLFFGTDLGGFRAMMAILMFSDLCKRPH